jgi:hypothetical protein
LKDDFSDHEVATVPEMRWNGFKNGELLRVAENDFEVFLTIDQGLRYQQNLRRTRLAVILFVAPDNRIETLRPLVPKALRALATVKSGEVIRIE